MDVGRGLSTFCYPERRAESRFTRIDEILRSLRFLRMTDVGIFAGVPKMKRRGLVPVAPFSRQASGIG
jgi:hypothetical protein